MKIEGRRGKEAMARGHAPPALKRMKPCKRGHERRSDTVVWTMSQGSTWSAQCIACRRIIEKRTYQRNVDQLWFKEQHELWKRRTLRKKKLLRYITRWRMKMKPLKTMYEDIKDFHTKFGLEYKNGPRHLPAELALFRGGFMAEELAEYATQSKVDQDMFVASFRKMLIQGNGELEKRLDALVDLVYVALGTAYMHGFDFDEAWRRVHKANMQKVRSQRKGDGSYRGGEFDVVKPEGWAAPDLSDLVVPKV